MPVKLRRVLYAALAVFFFPVFLAVYSQKYGTSDSLQDGEIVHLEQSGNEDLDFVLPGGTSGEAMAIKEPNSPNLPFKVLLDVPFTSQAPFGDWDDPRQQNGCEEASMLMAVYWSRGMELPPRIAREEIEKMSDFHLTQHGHFHDQSNADVYSFLREYFNFEKAAFVEKITIVDIKQALSENKVVILPINGQKVKNPYYIPPGPTNHKIVVVGYDDETEEFITHDPGTGQGKNFRYSYKIIENAMEDYPTGLHEKYAVKKVSMVTVEKETK